MEDKCVCCGSNVSDMNTQICVNCQSGMIKTKSRNIRKYNFCAKLCTKIKYILSHILNPNLKKKRRLNFV